MSITAHNVKKYHDLLPGTNFSAIGEAPPIGLVNILNNI